MNALESYRYSQLLNAVHDLKRELHAKIDTIIQGQQHIMALVDQEDAELTAIEASIAQLGSGITAVLTEVANAGTGQVTQHQVDRLTAIAAALQGDVAQLPTAAPTVTANTGVGALPGTNPVPTPVDTAASPTSPASPSLPDATPVAPTEQTPDVPAPVSDPLPDSLAAPVETPADPVTPVDVAAPAPAPTTDSAEPATV